MLESRKNYLVTATFPKITRNTRWHHQCGKHLPDHRICIFSNVTNRIRILSFTNNTLLSFESVLVSISGPRSTFSSSLLGKIFFFESLRNFRLPSKKNKLALLTRPNMEQGVERSVKKSNDDFSCAVGKSS